MKYFVFLLTLSVLFNYAAGAEDLKDLGEAVYRVNCGFMAGDDAKLAGGEIKGWLRDQLLDEGNGDWGAVNGDLYGSSGGTVIRDLVLWLHNTKIPQVYRCERYFVKAYEFKLPKGTYAVRLHFMETWDKDFQADKRVFDLDINDKEILKDFDLFFESGGFCQPVMIEVYGLKPVDNKIIINFQRNALINGIEIFKTKPSKFKIKKITPGKIKR